MKLLKPALIRTLTAGVSQQRRYLSIRNTPGNDGTGTGTGPGNNGESYDDFRQRLFGPSPPNNNSNDVSDSFYRKLDKFDRGSGRMGLGRICGMNGDGDGDDLDESFSTVSDGLDGRLKNAAKEYFEVDPEEIEKEDYSFRPDVDFKQGDTYDTKDLDLTKPGFPRQSETWDFEVTTAEVLKKADFRNVRFLANFLTDAGIIIKRSHTGISAKAQRKVAREIKIARAFGLMPFTTMGQFPFVAGRTREELESDDDSDLQSYITGDRFVDAEEPAVDPAIEEAADP